MVITTTNSFSMIKDLKLAPLFGVSLRVPALDEPAQVKVVLDALGVKLSNEGEFEEVCRIVLATPIGIKQLLTLIDVAMMDNVLLIERLAESYDFSVKRLKS